MLNSIWYCHVIIAKDTRNNNEIILAKIPTDDYEEANKIYNKILKEREQNYLFDDYYEIRIEELSLTELDILEKTILTKRILNIINKFK